MIASLSPIVVDLRGPKATFTYGGKLSLRFAPAQQRHAIARHLLAPRGLSVAFCFLDRQHRLELV